MDRKETPTTRGCATGAFPTGQAGQPFALLANPAVQSDHMSAELDTLDIDLLGAMREHPRIGVLELSRVLQVARGTVQARLDRLERAGIISGYGPEIDVAAAGY